jgi:hypothetical protein
MVAGSWTVDLSAYESELVAWPDDLEILGSFGTDRELGQIPDEAIQNSVHETSGWVGVSPPRSTPTTEYLGPWECVVAGERPRPRFRTHCDG